MKNAEEFTNIKFHGLSKTEELIIKKIIDRILANHANDEWWKIETAIKSSVNRNLSIALSDAVFSEKLEREKAREAAEQAEKERIAREEAEKEKREKEEADKESDKILADMLETNAERRHELMEKIKNGEAPLNNIGEDGGPTMDYRIQSYDDYGAHGELPKSDQVEGGE